MDHVICINKNSFPAHNINSGTELFDDAIQGVLELQSGSDRFFFYLDSNNGGLQELKIAEGLTYGNFIDNCKDEDLKLFLYEVEDKSPALDYLTDSQIEEITEYNFYVDGEPIHEFLDVFGLAWVVSGILLSLNTGQCWQSSEINIARSDENGIKINELLTLKNISSKVHGVTHFNFFNEVDIVQLVAPHTLSANIQEWYSDLIQENKIRVIDKLKLACARDFQGGMPLFKTLDDSDGIREIRFNAYSGGAIRIFFKKLEAKKQAILFGFIKKSNTEGYKTAQEQSNKIYSDLIEKNQEA